MLMSSGARSGENAGASIIVSKEGKNVGAKCKTQQVYKKAETGSERIAIL